MPTCGAIGVMGDLGMHAVHIPFRLGWYPRRVYAQLQKIYHERPDGRGGMAPCDTWDNALLHTEVVIDGAEVPMQLELKRLAPGETNTWFLEVLGTDGGVKYSTKTPKTLWTFQRGKEQSWQRTDLGFHGPFPTITGAIFEPGFPDCFLQMWAAFMAERAGVLGDRFGCVTPEEAVRSHELFAAALQSHAEKKLLSWAIREGRLPMKRSEINPARSAAAATERTAGHSRQSRAGTSATSGSEHGGVWTGPRKPGGGARVLREADVRTRDDDSGTCPCQEEGGHHLPLGQVGGAGLGGQASAARE